MATLLATGKPIEPKQTISVMCEKNQARVPLFYCAPSFILGFFLPPKHYTVMFDTMQEELNLEQLKGKESHLFINRGEYFLKKQKFF